MRSICETCGSQAWKGLLVACSKCRVACEHRYCMREHPLEASVDFVCADCSMGPVQKSIASASNKAVPEGLLRNRPRVESSHPVPKWKKIPESSRMKLISPDEVKKLSSFGVSKPIFKVPRPVPSRSAMGFTRQTVCSLSARRLNTAVAARKTKPIFLPPKKAEPLSPCGLQIGSGVLRQASKKQVGEGSTKSKVVGKAKDLASTEICQSILSEKLLQLLPYRPALRPTWRVRIMDSSTPSEFNAKFMAQPASTIRWKAYKLSKKVPAVLKVEMRPIGNLLNDLFVNRSPALSDVEMYIFPYDKSTKRFTEEHAHLFETMRTRNAMIRINIEGTPLLIFSSKLLEKASQNIIKLQKKTSNFLWGIYLLEKESLALVPGSSSQHFDDGDVVDNETNPRFRNTNHRSGKQLQRQYCERN